jgi:hypothetical protein
MTEPTPERRHKCFACGALWFTVAHAPDTHCLFCHSTMVIFQVTRPEVTE